MRKTLVFALVVTLAGCAWFRPIARTVNDIATDLCWAYVAENDLPAGWCSTKENLDPFVEYVLQAQRDGVQRAE